jgi:tyrosyl-tRNA synthetase
MASFASINEQMDLIRRGSVEIVPEDQLVRKLERSIRTERPLRVKHGFDPTHPYLHVGHAVSLRKLRTLQSLGHEIHIVVGDYTARIGDPSGRDVARRRLTPEEIAANADSYTGQVGRILDLAAIELHHNSEWLAPLTLAQFLELAATYPVAPLLERDDVPFRSRDGTLGTMLDLLYPLLQAYDSVALSADIEVGGDDQRFNLSVGRTVQAGYGQEPQVCIIMPLLSGTDGAPKMSKSGGNAIGIAEPPDVQYAKAMKIPDSVLDQWTRLAVPPEGDAALDAALALVARDPQAGRRAIATAIVTAYHSAEAARLAADRFERNGGRR